MNVTPDYVNKLPDVYRDFMLVLARVPESRNDTVRVAGLPLGVIFDALRFAGHPFEPKQVREMGDMLKKANWIEEDEFGFYKPTGPGEQLIDVIKGTLPSTEIPALPSLK